MKVGILGGGLTGLTIASCLHHDFEVLEKEPECGGLCKSIVDQGFTFDTGGAHIIFSRNQKPVEFMVRALGENCVRARRNNKVFFKDRYVKYPFENGLSDLSKEDNFECLYHYLVNDCPPPTNFKEWLYYTFGKGVAEKYLIPYNEKIWNTKLELLGFDWTEGRIPKPPVEDVIKSAIGIKTEGYTHQLYFYYPRHGGIQALIRALEKSASGRVRHKFKVNRIYNAGKQWVVCNQKEEIRFDKLISTMPIFALINSLQRVPREVADAVEALHYNSLISVMLGLDTDSVSDFTAVYFPDQKVKFHRIAFPMNFSQGNVPPGKSSLVAEITANPGDGTWEMRDGEIANHVIQSLDELGIIDRQAVCYTKVVRAKYAYIIYDLEYSKKMQIIRDFVADMGIELCGRFAEFEYLNMDACVERGMQMARKLNLLREEA
jgi:protoporphyrinogen oxidase